MTTTIAIQPDNYTKPDTPERCDASSPRWAELLQQAGYAVRWVDVRRADILEQLHGCAGFMWRWAHFGGMGRIARRLLPVLERYQGLTVYPDQATCWHFDDKLAQALLFPSLDIPAPRTWVWYDAASACAWLEQEARFPLVLKLAGGAGSSNVRLIHDAREGRRWVELLFDHAVDRLDPAQLPPFNLKHKLRACYHWLRWDVAPRRVRADLEGQCGYVLFQEFLPNNDFDTRVTVIGRRAFAYRRFNRPNDFRASGSGNFNPDPTEISPDMVKLAFRTARALGTQSVAIDGLRRGDEAVVGEVSYTYVSWMVHACPGHWEWQGTLEHGGPEWVPGAHWPEEYQVEDFLTRLEQRRPIRMAA